MRTLFLQERNAAGIGLIVADALFFGLTDPTRAPSAFFIIAFVLMATSIFWLFYAICRLIAWYGIKLKHQYRLVIAATSGICLLVALQSIGQLSSHDMAVFLPLSLLMYFYVSYNQRRYE